MTSQRRSLPHFMVLILKDHFFGKGALKRNVIYFRRIGKRSLHATVFLIVVTCFIALIVQASLSVTEVESILFFISQRYFGLLFQAFAITLIYGFSIETFEILEFYEIQYTAIIEENQLEA